MLGSLIFAGPLSPPVHGQMVATRDMLGLLERQGAVIHTFDTGGGQATKLRGHADAAMAISWRSAPFVYASVQSCAGLGLTIGLAAAARLRGKRLVLHHHSYMRIGAYCRVMAALVAAAGPDAVHLVQGPSIARAFTAHYGARNVATYSNIGGVALQPRRKPHLGVTLGHMSNLCMAKGLGTVIAAFQVAREHRLAHQLILAGPADDAAAEAIRNAGPGVHYIGPVYGEAKQRFFDEIDLFLFPSRYPHETQGIVNLEAMASGVPVIAFAQGCIGDDVGKTGGVAVRKCADFTRALLRYLARFDAAEASAMARARFDQLQVEHLRERARLIDGLRVRPAVAGAVAGRFA